MDKDKKEELLTIIRNSSLVFTIILILTLIIFFTRFKFVNLVREIFEKNLEVNQANIIFTILPGLITFGIILLAICIFYRISMGLPIKIQKKNRFWIALTLATMSFFFILGVIFLDVMGAQYLSLNLIKNGAYYQGNVSCYEINGRPLIYAEDKFNCNFYPGESLSNAYNVIRFKLTNGTEVTKQSNYFELEFVAPPDVESVSFTLIGYEMNTDKPVLFSSSYSYTFLTREQFEEKKKEFVSYFLGLLGLIILAVPSLIINIRKIISQ